MKYIYAIFTLVVLFGFTTDRQVQREQQSEMQRELATLSAKEKIEVFKKLLAGKGSCEYNGVKLYGKVKFVTSFPDIKVQYVNSFPDLKVKFVNSFADDCGEWQEVSSFPDFKVKLVTSFPDIKVKVVDSFPGM